MAFGSTRAVGSAGDGSHRFPGLAVRVMKSALLAVLQNVMGFVQVLEALLGVLLLLTSGWYLRPASGDVAYRDREDLLSRGRLDPLPQGAGSALPVGGRDPRCVTLSPLPSDAVSHRVRRYLDRDA
jgi:hypothetical protein